MVSFSNEDAERTMKSRTSSTSKRADALADATRGVVRLSRQVEITLGEFSLSVSQFRVLDRLSGGSAAGRSLAEWLAVKPPSITALVDGLVARGLVARTTDATDRRRVAHDLTADGRSLHQAVTEALASRLLQLVTFLADEQRSGEMIAGLSSWNEAIDLARDAKRAALDAARNR
jgi:long-chain acyl-CoA synthetase